MSLFETIVTAIWAAIDGRPAMTRPELEASLDELAIRNPERLDWRHSVVDLLKLTHQDSSQLARERLAAELGYQGHFNGDPAMNTWLHERIMADLEQRYVR